MKSLISLLGKATIVTGAAGGLGTKMVETLASLESDIVMLDMVGSPAAVEVAAAYGIPV